MRVLAVVWGLALVLVVPENKAQTTRRSAKDLQNSISREVRVIRSIEQKETTIAGQLEDIERDMQEQRQKLQTLRDSVRALTEKLAEMEADVRQSKEDLGTYFEGIKTNIVTLYKIKKSNKYNVLIDHKSYNDYMRSEKITEKIVSEDLRSISFFTDKLREYVRMRAVVRKQQEEVQRVRHQEFVREEALGQRKSEKIAFLARIKREKSLHEQALRELTDAQQRLSSMISNYETEEPAARQELPKNQVDLRLYKGHLEPPLRPGLVSATFGKRIDPLYKTEIFYKGVDFSGEAETQIEAVFGGRVIFANRFQGYGNLLIVDHGYGYYTLYAHLSRARKIVGEEIQAREVIGNLGDTESLKGPVLYFELRHNGKNLNPLDWFKRESYKLLK